MKRVLVIALRDSEGRFGRELIAQLPPHLASFGAGLELRLPVAEVELAKQVLREAARRSWVAQVTGQVEWENQDADSDRLVYLDLPRGPRFHEREFVTRVTCRTCRQTSFRQAAPARLDVGPFRPSPGGPVAVLSESGLSFVISTEAAESLAAAGLLTGAQLLPVGDGTGRPVSELRAVTGVVSLGRFRDDQFESYCSECAAPTRGGGFLRMYPRPKELVDVYATDWFGPTVPIVSQRLARALDVLNGTPVERPRDQLGWWPDDQALSQLPLLSS